MRALLEGDDLISPGTLSSSNTEILQVVRGVLALVKNRIKRGLGGLPT